MTLHQLGRLVRVLGTPSGFKAFCTWRPFSITSYLMLRSMKQQGFEFATIIDGGANIGQFARAAAENFPSADIICFEPLPDIIEQLTANLSDRVNVRIIGAALGSKIGTTVIHRNTSSGASSILEMDLDARKIYPKLREIDSFEVPIVTLDHALSINNMRRPILLKLDLQGYELEALRGAPKTLVEIDYVLMEASFRRTYRNEPTFNDLYDLMRDSGLLFVKPLDYLEDNYGALSQIDALFVRASTETALGENE